MINVFQNAVCLLYKVGLLTFFYNISISPFPTGFAYPHQALTCTNIHLTNGIDRLQTPEIG
jgi:hypothetical protein